MKNIHQLALFAFFLLSGHILHGQTDFFNGEPCHADEIHQELLESDPDYFLKDQQLKQIILKKIKENKGKVNKSGNTVYTIPVVVHVIHRTGIPVGQEENRSYQDIVDLVQALNDDFAHASGITYPNPNYGVDTDIEFCLAARDPNGNPSNGIDRHADDARTVYDRDNPSNNPTPGLRPMYHWTPTEYYNIYLIHDIIGAAGFATYATSHGSQYDGAVMQASVSAGVWSHEVGHGMYLRHTFQDSCINNNCWTDGDDVCDTPPRGTSGYAGGTCTNPANTCTTDEDDPQTDNPYRPVSAGGMGDQPDMFENYMDYTGGCWSAFTIDQKDRMRWAIDTYRSSYLSSNACTPVVADDAAALDVYFRDTCKVALIGANGIFGNFGSNALTSVDLELYIDNVLKETISWTGNLSYAELDTVTFSFVSATAGNREVCIKVKNPNGNSDGNALNDQSCKDFFLDLYCKSMSNSTTFMYIDSVSVGSVHNQSGRDGGYGNYTGMVFSGELAHPVNYYLKPGYLNTQYGVHWNLWCDLNGDYDFDDPGELILTQYSNTPISGTFDIPYHANTGQTRFRIVMSYSSGTGPEGTYSNGETEDYTIDILPVPYANDVNVVRFTPQDTCGASHIGASVIIQNTGTANLTSAEIDLKIDGTTASTTPWSGNLSFGAKDTFELAMMPTTVGMHNLCIKGKNPNGISDEYPGNDEQCQEKYVDTYCPSYSTVTSTRYIDSVSVETVHNQTGRQDDGYGNYTNLVFTGELGHPVSYYFANSPSSGTLMYWDVWCDFNGDFDFSDPGELIWTKRSNIPVSGTFDIPVDASTGQTRFRIVHSFNSNTGAEGTYTFGETEDYTIDIMPSSYVNDVKVVGFTPIDSCGAATIGATVIIQNVGSANLVSANIDFKIDGTVVSNTPWTGNLAFGELDTFDIPQATTTVGLHSLCIDGNMPNGEPDDFPDNNEACVDKFVDTYCLLVANSSSLMWADSVRVGEIDTLSGNNGGYGHFLNLSTDLSIGHPVDYYLAPGYFNINYDMYWSVWIDLNGDFDFSDPGEFNYLGRSSSPLSGQLMILPNATPGPTRMRIAATYYYPPVDGTGTTTYGEVEDYSVELVDNGCFTISSFPYTESFETGLGTWFQDPGDDFDWTRDANGTPSSGTGPSSASDGDYYLYTEASSPNFPSKKAILFSTCFDFGFLDAAELTFDYHMYGTYTGTLDVEVSDDNGNTWSAPLWSMSGNQGDQWHQATVDLSAYDGQTIRLRFTGTTGLSWSSDMAIDNLKVDGTTVSCPQQLTVNDDPIPSNTYEALQSIYSDGGRVDGAGNVIFTANDSVLLDSFTVDLGGVFEVIMGGACGPPMPVVEGVEK